MEEDPIGDAMLGGVGGLLRDGGEAGLLSGGRSFEKPCPSKALLDKKYPRVKPRKGLRHEVWNRNKAANGRVYDPSGREIKPGDPWELGHVPGEKFSDAQMRAYEEGWDSQTWRDYQNDPDIYRPELPSSNASHAHEANWRF